MNHCTLTQDQISDFCQYLRQEERAAGTLEKYLRDLQSFFHWLHDRPVTKEIVTQWKMHLTEHYAPSTVNSMLAALNGLFRFLGWNSYRVRFLKLQRRLFRDQNKEITQSDYKRLITTAQELGHERLSLLMQTICATGIRVSEVPYITVSAAQSGHVKITLKGKIREILLPDKLCRKLLKYAQKNKIASGEIFLTRSGRSLSRRQIWAEMKRLSKLTGIHPGKVYPHNLRHLFAVTFYQAYKDIAKLADILGHSSIETTRIYLLTTGEAHLQQLNRLGLVT